MFITHGQNKAGIVSFHLGDIQQHFKWKEETTNLCILGWDSPSYAIQHSSFKLPLGECWAFFMKVLYWSGPNESGSIKNNERKWPLWRQRNMFGATITYVWRQEIIIGMSPVTCCYTKRCSYKLSQLSQNVYLNKFLGEICILSLDCALAIIPRQNWFQSNLCD